MLIKRVLDALLLSFLFSMRLLAEGPVISLNHSELHFGADPNGAATPSQTLLINASGLTWTLTSNQGWLQVNPASGGSPGIATVSVNPSEMQPGTYTGEITVYAEGADNSPRTVNVVLTVLAETDPPFGSFDTPLDGSTVSGSVAVAGWVLDDINVETVTIYRKIEGGMAYVGDALMVEGARPDVEQAYPGYPQNYKAGWGYMMLTNFLPDGGNGAFTLEVIASDGEGHRVGLGIKTIYCDNAHAVKPFGAIDTPVQGGIASGNRYVNRGWVVTPYPNTIPLDGSTIDVYVDGVMQGHPVYNIFRADIAATLSGTMNSEGAGVYYTLDTKAYENGIHTIEWIVTDNAGNADGIGSRYFTVQNTDEPCISVNRESLTYGTNRSGAGGNSQELLIENSGGGELNWQAVSDQGWLKLSSSSGTNSGVIYAWTDPAGLDPGMYSGTISISDINAINSPVKIPVILNVNSVTYPPYGSFDYAPKSQIVHGSVELSGWAVDECGIVSVKLYYWVADSWVFLGDAGFVEGIRPDIESWVKYYPEGYKAGWGYSFLTNFLPGGGNGQVEIKAVATDVEGNEESLTGTKGMYVDNSNSVKPFGIIDTPVYGGVACGDNYIIWGWALTPQPNKIPEDGSTIDVYVDGVNIGHPVYNLYKADIAMLFPGYTNTDGAAGYFSLNTTEYENGVHRIEWIVTDNAGNQDGIGRRYFNVQNLTEGTGVRTEDTGVPKETELMPAYPNPFNPETRITYRLAENARVDLTVYDILGRRVRILVNGESRTRGIHLLDWQGRDEHGQPVSSGIYLIVLRAGGVIRAQKIMVVR